MGAPPSLFGYLIFAALVLASSACNSKDVMTSLLQYWLALSGDSFSCFCFLFVGLLFHCHLVMYGTQQIVCKAIGYLDANFVYYNLMKCTDSLEDQQHL
ncbi:hypothetical protein V8B97DRAFT_1956147 [Scleroderma yunnanense]